MIARFLATPAAWVIAALLALLAIQTVRLEGLRVWPASIEGARPKAARLQRTIDEIEAAQKQALRAAQEAVERAEREYAAMAERIDDDAEKAREGAMGDAERFIAAHRVQCPTNRGSGSGTAPTPSGDGAGRGESPGPAPIVDDAVAVTASDVRICTDNTVRLEAAREWALELEGD